MKPSSESHHAVGRRLPLFLNKYFKLSSEKSGSFFLPVVTSQRCIVLSGDVKMPDIEETSPTTTVAQKEEAPAPEQAAPVPEKEDFDRLLNSYSQFSQPPLGALLRGRVVKIAGTEVIVDVGYKCEGVISAEEFKDREGRLRIQPGDEIEVMMESAEEREGYVVLSRERAKRLKVWDDIESAYERQSVVPAVVLERIKGGLAVDIGVRAFL